ncbi:MAG: hypothetical protein ACR2LI_14555, partial [Propionibacteriaceae bacterium]
MSEPTRPDHTRPAHTEDLLAPGGPRLIFCEALTRYDFGPDHAMAPGRVANTISLATALGVLEHLEVVPPPPSDRALLELVHHDDYIAAVELG